MKSRKLRIEDLNVKSFTTSNQTTLKGGGTEVSYCGCETTRILLCPTWNCLE